MIGLMGDLLSDDGPFAAATPPATPWKIARSIADYTIGTVIVMSFLITADRRYGGGEEVQPR